MKTFLIALSMLSAMAVATHADETPPRYDPADYCKGISEFSGGSAMIYNGCIEQEQMSYNSLKAEWPSLSSRIKSYCDEIARFADGSYALLKSCVDMEKSASSDTNEFKF